MIDDILFKVLLCIVSALRILFVLCLLLELRSKTERLNLILLSLAWYDLELSQYQKERHETELEKVFDERNTTFRESGMNVSGVHIQPKEFKEEQTEWQKSVKSKKGEEYYNKIQELENEQVTKEIKLRESSHQYAIPGEKIVSSSLARGMAQQYQETL